MKIVQTQIILNKVKIFAHHGVLPQERTVGANFYVSLKIDTDFSNALTCDELSNTVSYADVYKRVCEEMATPSALLEHAAGRILSRLFSDFPTIEGIQLTLTKENPPMGADCQECGVEISARR